MMFKVVHACHFLCSKLYVQSAQQWQFVFCASWIQQIMLASTTYDFSSSCGDDKPLSASSKSETEAPSPIVANDKDNNVDTARFMNQDDCSVFHEQKEKQHTHTYNPFHDSR